ncbi:MAG: helix-turn-helix domain-containing protein [Patescibacteria group bacterium]
MNEDFQLFLATKLKEKSLSLKKLSELTGIALKHLENINSGNWNDLPAAPYIRGYLVKISEVLDFDPNEWWKIMRGQEISISGSSDALPKNRFNRKSGSKKLWVFGVILILLLAYFGLRFSKIFGRPEIVVNYPPEDVVTTSSEEIIITGTLTNGDKLFINSESVLIEPDSTWQKSFTLGTNNPNVFEITAKKFLGRETKITRQIIFEPGEDSKTPRPTATSTLEESTSTEDNQ